MEAQNAQPEPRSLPRYAVNAEATVVIVNQGPSLSGRIVELSLDGCRLNADGDCPLATPASIEVMFKLRGMGFRLGGTMQWTEARKTAGIQFGPMAPRRRDILLDLLAELETEKHKKAAEKLAEAGGSGPKPGATEIGAPAPASVPALPATDRKSDPGIPAAQETPHASSRRERRSQQRRAVDGRATVFFVDVGDQTVGRIVDVSLSGCRIRTEQRFTVGIYRRVETEFKLDGLPFRLPGVVQSLHDKFTVGIRFLDVSARKREQLAQLMEEIEEAGIRDHGLGIRD